MVVMNIKSIARKIYCRVLRLLRKWWHAPFLIISLPVSFVLIMLFPFFKVKFIRLCSDRIGHYAMNTELLLCYLDEIKLKEKNTKYFFYTLDAPICNDQLHRMWKRTMPIIVFPKIMAQINACMRGVYGDYYKDDVLKKFESGAGNEDSDGYLRKYSQHLFFVDNELKKGKELLSNLGIPAGASFVCFVVRDSAYLNKYLPKNDWSYHFYRDSNIENFSKAALFLANKGYYVIRMGKAVQRHFDVKHHNIIDYANLSLRSDFADIYLSAHCKFFISTPTGLDAIPEIFRKPVLFVNVAPFLSELQYWYPGEFFIFKKIYDNTNRRFVLLNEVDEKINNPRDISRIFDRLDWVIVENTEDEILEAVQEMEDHVNQKFKKKNNPFCALLKTSLPFSVLSNRDALRENPEKFYIRMCDEFFYKNFSKIFGDAIKHDILRVSNVNS